MVNIYPFDYDSNLSLAWAYLGKKAEAMGKDGYAGHGGFNWFKGGRIPGVSATQLPSPDGGMYFALPKPGSAALASVPSPLLVAQPVLSSI